MSGLPVDARERRADQPVVDPPRDAPAGRVHGLVPGDETGEGFPLTFDRPGRPVGHPAGGSVDPGDVVAREGLTHGTQSQKSRELTEVVAASHRRPEAAKEDDGEE